MNMYKIYKYMHTYIQYPVRMHNIILAITHWWGKIQRVSLSLFNDPIFILAPFTIVPQYQYISTESNRCFFSIYTVAGTGKFVLWAVIIEFQNFQLINQTGIYTDRYLLYFILKILVIIILASKVLGTMLKLPCYTPKKNESKYHLRHWFFSLYQGKNRLLQIESSYKATLGPANLRLVIKGFCSRMRTHFRVWDSL